MKIKDLKVGDYFKRKETAKAVYVVGEYDKSSKSYACHKFDDVNSEIHIKGDKEVFTEFTF